MLLNIPDQSNRSVKTVLAQLSFVDQRLENENESVRVTPKHVYRGARNTDNLFHHIPNQCGAACTYRGCRMHLDTRNRFHSQPNFLNYRRAGLLERSDSAGYKFLELVSTYTDGLGLQHMTGGSTNESQNAAAGCDQLQYGIAGSTANELAGNCNGQNSGARKASRKSTVCRLIRQHCPRTAGLPI